MLLRISQFIKIPLTFITLLVMVFGFMCIGMFSHASMNMADMNMGAMSGDQTSQCCTLGTMHHLDSWKNIILVAPDKIRDAFFAFVFGIVLLAYAVVSVRRFALQGVQYTPLLFYTRDHPDLVLYNHLKRAFARGILNPKLY